MVVTGLFAGVLLVLFETSVAEPDPRRTVGELLLPGEAEPTPVLPLPYGGALQRPTSPDDLLGPGGMLGLGLLVLGLANGLVFLTTATWDGMAAPSPAETRRRLSSRSDPGMVPGGRREVRRTVPLRATAPAASDGPALQDASALRSVPGRPVPGTTYAPFPRPGTAWREHVAPPAAPPTAPPVPEPAPAPLLEEEPAPAAEPDPEPLPEAPVPLDPVTELDPVVPEAPAQPAQPVAPRRPSPVPRDGGDGPKRATRRGSGPWGWRPARPDPVPWRNPVPALAH
ncbi:hypothetical protein PHK61_00500 [Actinomycetospora lutea]|uniref:hypothetical protein n=1 Tax=Actinomycetospora lutea TaxID=663604 RepID=UPI00236558F8|nr:hypothetical protein [Actinomycetospora lutea]MDD7936895.1 hypothetical protein [Actinomycetospora lutea]